MKKTNWSENNHWKRNWWHKDDSDSAKTSSGRLFQICDAAAEKALPPTLTFWYICNDICKCHPIPHNCFTTKVLFCSIPYVYIYSLFHTKCSHDGNTVYITQK